MKRSLIIILLTLSSFIATAIPRAEYPRPQFERSAWINLNGEWSYELDPVMTGTERGLAASKGFDGTIIVPFAPESKLSGVEHKDFIPAIWYQREITAPKEWSGKNILLNFGAVYYVSEIYIDGKFVHRHHGGSDSFSVDITKFIEDGKPHSLVVYATSDLRSRMQPAGKQSLRHGSHGCMYTRTTGIWQTVWMEAVAEGALKSVDTVTDIDRSQVTFGINLFQNISSNKLRVSVYDGDKIVASDFAPVSSGSMVTLPIKKMKTWSPESPFLYDVKFEVVNKDGIVIDEVKSYFGMRKIHVDGNKIYLNNEPYYQRLVLDQGFYPDGIWTAPSDDALRQDIELSMEAGFNGARLHQKVFEERFYYWADKLGYLTWGEAPSWGFDANDPVAQRNFLAEWTNLVNRDKNHPSLVAWTPMNEEWWPDYIQYPRFVVDLYEVTKIIDPTRPVNTVSGGIAIKTDIWTEHNYEQNADRLESILLREDGSFFQRNAELQGKPSGNVGFNTPVLEAAVSFPKYDGSVPYFLDEFGGIKCAEANPSKNESWGYGDAAVTIEDFYTRLESQVRMLMKNTDKIWGFCYTQLTDVEQEQNGIFYYDRQKKYDMKRIHEIFSMPIIEE